MLKLAHGVACAVRLHRLYFPKKRKSGNVTRNHLTQYNNMLNTYEKDTTKIRTPIIIIVTYGIERRTYFLITRYCE